MRYYFKYDLTSEEAYEITNVILPLNYLDRLDGLRDSLSFEFMLDDDLLPTYYKNKKCQFIIKDDNNNILKDLAMCITDINRDTNTMYEKNNAPIYIYSITLTEPTILIDKCVRTDIAITPNAYITENYQQPYSSLWDAYVKVMTCHNLNTRNEKVYNPYNYVVGLNDTNIDFNIVNVPDGNITANLTINNVLKTSRNQYVNIDGTINVVNEIISLPSVNISDEVLPITKTITGQYTLTNSALPELDIDESFIQTLHIYYENNKIKIEQTSTSTKNIMYTNWTYDFTYGTKGTLTLRKMLSNLPCPTLTYVDLSTYTQLTDIFDRVGLVPYLTFATSGENVGKCYIEVFEKEGSYDINEGIKTIEEVSSTEIAKINDECFASVTTQAKNVVCDNTDIVIYPQTLASVLIENNFPESINILLRESYADWQLGKEVTTDIKVQYITQAVPESFNESSGKIKDASQYSIQVPSNIEDILYIYLIKPKSSSSNEVTLNMVDPNRFVEYSAFKGLQENQKRYFAYYVRGENTLNQPLALTASFGELDGDYKWNSDDAYKKLRETRLIIVYKPMLDQTYTMYNYNTLDATTTENISLPFKQTNDNQITSILTYEMERADATNIILNITTNDTSILNYYAGQKVYFKENKFISANYLGEFQTFDELILMSNPILDDVKLDSWAKVGTQIYVIDKTSKTWIKYVGELCVITSINFQINNNTISATIELATNIAKTSSISGYSDNIRVSDNLSTETVVTRQTTIYKTFLLNCIANNILGINDFPTISLQSNMILKYCDAPIFACGLHSLGCFGEIADSSNEIFSKIETNLEYFRLLDFNIYVGKEQIPQLPTEYDKSIDVNEWDSFETTNRLSQILNEDEVRIRVKNVNGELQFDIGESRTPVVIADNNKNIITMLGPTLDELRAYLPKSRFNSVWTNLNGKYSIEISDENIQVVKLTFAYTANNKSYKFSQTYHVDRIYNIFFDRPLYAGRLYRNYPNYVVNTELMDTGVNYLVSNRNPIWVNSNKLLQATLCSIEENVLGYYTKGFSEADDGKYKMFNQTEPLFLKKSSNNAKLYGVGNYANLGMNYFEDIVKETGFTDLLLDVRERPYFSIQYLVLPNNTIDYYTKHNLWDYGLYNPSFVNRILHIEEISNTINWFNTRYETLEESNSLLIIKKVPKGTTINNIKNNFDDYEIYDNAFGTLELQDDNRLYTINAKITLETKTFERDLENNYCIINANNNEPLFIVSTNNVSNGSPQLPQQYTDLKSVTISAVIQ